MSSRPSRIPTRSRPGRLPVFRKIGLFATIALTGLVLFGCAAQMAYRDGRELVALGKVEEGLGKFQEASRQDPRNAEYKSAYIQTRDRTVLSYLEQADRLGAEGKRGDAEKLYQRALALDPGSERAREGLRKLEMEARHAQLLKDAQAAVKKKDVETARQKIGVVMTENPGNDAARALFQSISEHAVGHSPEAQLAAAYKKKISIEFRDVPLKRIFEVISRTSGLNFLFDKDVKTDQKTSIFLKNSTIESAVFYTLLTNQLDQQVLDANTVLIYPNTVAKQKEYQELVVKSFFLANAEAKTVANTLKTILKSRDVVIDEKLNMLVVRDSPDAIKLAERLIAMHDVPEPEVMLEVEIMEVKRTSLLELGIKWPDSLTLTPLATPAGRSLTLRDLQNQSSATLGVGNPAVTVNASKNDSDANLLANPRIRARNREKAKILIGERVPNITSTATSTGFVSESITYVDVGLKLEVEPTIYLDNDVAIKVALEVSNIVSQIQTRSGSVAYQLGTRTTSTVLRLKDGETQVLAGLINDEERSSASKVPVLGEVPVLGRLFGSSADDSQKTEIVMSITPRLVRNIQRPDAAFAQFRSGTETSLRLRPQSGAQRVTALAGPARTAESPQAALPAAGAAPGGNAETAPAAEAASEAGKAPADEAGKPAEKAAEKATEAAAAAKAQWRGPAQSRVGSNFTVQLSMQSDEQIGSLPVTVGFDSNVLQVVRVAEGNFLKQGGAQTEFSSEIDPKGQILLKSARTGGAGGGGGAAGTFAAITFRTLAPAEASSIEVLSMAPVSAAGRAVNVTLPAGQTIRVRQ